MTLDEAIEHAEEMAKMHCVLNNKYNQKCAEEHRQLAEWLKELKKRREQPEIIRCKDCKHYQFADNRAFGMPVKMCEWFGFEDADDDDFCSRAERRTDE